MLSAKYSTNDYSEFMDFDFEVMMELKSKWMDR